MLVFWVFCKRFDKSGINILWQFFISVLFSSFPGEKFWLPEYSEYSSSAALNRIRYFHLGGKGGIWIRETGPQGGWETECCCYWRRRKREFATQQRCSKRGEKEEKGQLANCFGGSFVSRIFLHHVWKCFWFLLFCVDWDVTVEKNQATMISAHSYYCISVLSLISREIHYFEVLTWEINVWRQRKREGRTNRK